MKEINQNHFENKKVDTDKHLKRETIDLTAWQDTLESLPTFNHQKKDS